MVRGRLNNRKNSLKPELEIGHSQTFFIVTYTTCILSEVDEIIERIICKFVALMTPENQAPLGTITLYIGNCLNLKCLCKGRFSSTFLKFVLH